MYSFWQFEFLKVGKNAKIRLKCLKIAVKRKIPPKIFGLFVARMVRFSMRSTRLFATISSNVRIQVLIQNGKAFKFAGDRTEKEKENNR